MRNFQSWSTIFSSALAKNKRGLGICLLASAIPLVSQGPLYKSRPLKWFSSSRVGLGVFPAEQK